MAQGLRLYRQVYLIRDISFVFISMMIRKIGSKYRKYIGNLSNYLTMFSEIDIDMFLT